MENQNFSISFFPHSLFGNALNSLYGLIITHIFKVLTLAKDQIMSECIYEIINFPKYHQKNLIDFYLGRFYRLRTCNLF